MPRKTTTDDTQEPILVDLLAPLPKTDLKTETDPRAHYGVYPREAQSALAFARGGVSLCLAAHSNA